MGTPQLLYSIAALAIVMVFSLTFRGSMISSNQQVFLNEIGTQLTGVAYDVLEDIGRKDLAFDRNTNESLMTPPITYPVITSRLQLTYEGSAEWGNCIQYEACEDVDDFHGIRDTATVEGIIYVFDVSVQYVSETDPDSKSYTPTYAKEVTVEVWTPWFLAGNDTLRTTLSRIFTYERVTSP